MKRASHRWWLALPSVLVILLSVSMALGAPDAKAQAQKLATQGKELVTKGKFDAAAEKFRQADELNPAPSYKLELARMLIEMQDFVGSGDVLRAAVEMSPQQWVEKKAKTQCEELLKEVGDRTPKLRISVYEPEASQVKITVDGSPFDVSAGVGDFNPGDHQVTAKAAGYQTYDKKVTLKEAATEEIEITMSKGGGGGGDDGGGAPVEEDGGDGAGITPIPAYVLWGVGAVAIGVGIGFGVKAIQTTNDVLQLYDCEDGQCCTAENPCTENEKDQFETDLKAAKTNGNVSTAMFVIGGAAVAAGTVLFFFSSAWLDDDDGDGGDDEEKEGMLRFEARPLVGPGYVGLTGVF